MPITIFITDDHLILRQGLISLLDEQPDFEVVGEASNGLDAIRRIGECTPQVLVLDLMMSGMNGIDVIRRVKKKYPHTRMVVLSMHDDSVYVRTALAAGALGYVVKAADVKEVAAAIRNVAAGRKYVSRSLQSLLDDDRRPTKSESQGDPIDQLTPREMEIMDWTVLGKSSGEVGELLKISPRTVESHRANLMEKLGVRNQRELVRYVTERRLQTGNDLPLDR